MTLTFIIDIFGVGGKERRCLQLIKGLNKSGLNDIHLIVIDNYIGYNEIYDLNVKLHIVGRKYNLDPTVPFKIYKILRQIKPDIVLSWSLMSSFWLNIIHVFYKFNYICAYVADTITHSFFSLGNVSRFMSIKHANYIIGNSQIGLDTYKIPAEKAILIYNGYDFSRNNNLSEVHLVRQSLLIHSKYLVCMVGTVAPAKDYGTFIEVARLIRKERFDISFLAVGDGPQLEFFRNSLSVQEAEFIKFIGYRKNVEEIIHASDICVLCSPSEGVSNFILEAMALGKPVIATNTGGTPEIVQDGVSGFLVQHKNVSEISNRITYLLNDEVFRLQFGENAREVVKTNFSIERMTEQFYNLFKSITKI